MKFTPLQALSAAANLALLASAAWLFQRTGRERRRLESNLDARRRELAAREEALAQTSVEMSQANELYQQVSQRFEALFQGLPIACFCYDGAGRLVEWNQAFETLFDLNPDAILMKPIWTVLGNDDAEAVNRSVIDRVLGGESFEGLEWEHSRPDGTVTHILCNTFPLRDAKGEIVGGITIDIDVTVRKRFEKDLLEANEKLAALATHDGMTGLKNHGAFQERLAHEFARARRDDLPLSLILLDADRFKDYNDRWGHLAGDEALRCLARLLLTTARADDFAARYGGEEFVIILPETDLEVSKVVAERFREAIARAEWPQQPLTASLGVSTLRPSIQSVSQLIAEADAALYASKAGGRNRVTHHSITDVAPAPRA